MVSNLRCNLENFKIDTYIFYLFIIVYIKTINCDIQLKNSLCVLNLKIHSLQTYKEHFRITTPQYHYHGPKISPSFLKKSRLVTSYNFFQSGLKYPNCVEISTLS